MCVCLVTGKDFGSIFSAKDEDPNGGRQQQLLFFSVIQSSWVFSIDYGC
jgi:hypothetical protein